jgi:hypothetical protein
MKDQRHRDRWTFGKRDPLPMRRAVAPARVGEPSRLGYRFIGEQPDQATAPNDTGIVCIWCTKRSEWR